MSSIQHSRIHFEQIPFSIQLLSPEGKTLAVNGAWKELWKIPEDVIQNYILKDYDVANDPQLEAKGIGHLIRKGLSGEVVEIPAILYDPKENGMEGDSKWVSGYMYPVRDQNGKLVEIVLTHQNMTEKKIAENELKRSRDQLAVILEGVIDGILVQDTNYCPVYANEAAARLCGFKTAEELCNASLVKLLENFEFRDQDGNPFPVDNLPARRALSGGGPQEGAVIRVRNLSSGKDTWSKVSAKPVLDENGIPYLAVSIFRDITEEKLQEDRRSFLNQATSILSTSLDYHETLNKIANLAVKSLADWCSIDVIEDDGPKTVAVAHVNPEKLGFAQEFMEKYPKDWNAPTGSPHVIRTGFSELYPEISQELLGKVTKDSNHLAMIKQLGLKSAMIVPLKTKNKIMGAITFIGAESERHYNETDLEMAKELGERSALALENAQLYQRTERLAQDLQNAVKARDEFISICSHELKTPITSIKLQYQIIDRMLKAGNETALLLENYEKRNSSVNRQLDRMVKLIDEMLDVSRVNTGKLEMEHCQLDLRDIIEEILARFSDQFNLKGIELNVLLGSEACIVTGDRFRLEQVFSNIITNALKYGDTKPVDVQLIKKSDVARIEFSDQGIGIPPEHLERIFNRFERVSSAYNISGLGLGLYISKQIVLAHNGKIWASNRHERGTTFIVELPLCQDI